MKQGVANVKERYNWPVTILLIRRNRADHSFASVYGTDDRNQGSVRHEQYPGIAQKAASAELRRCLGDDRFPEEIF